MVSELTPHPHLPVMLISRLAMDNCLKGQGRGAFLLTARSCGAVLNRPPLLIQQPSYALVLRTVDAKKSPSTWWQIDGFEEAPTSATNKKMDGALRMKQRLSWGFTGFLTR
jgi:hypothetical protein